MRERASLFAVSLIAIAALLLALSRQVALRNLRQEVSGKEAAQQSQTAQLQTTVATLTEKIKQLKAEPSPSIRDVLAKVDAIQKDLGARIEKLQQAQAAADALAGKLDTVAKSVDAMKKAAAAQGASTVKLEATTAKLEATTAGIAQKITALAGKTESLDKVVESTAPLAAKVAALEKAAAASATENKTSAEKIVAAGAKLDQQVAGLQAKLDAQAKLLAADAQRHTAQWSAQRRVIEALRSDLANLSGGGSGVTPGGGSRRMTPPAIPLTADIKATTGTIVVLSAGEKAGIKAGQILFVTRGGGPIARLKAVNVHDHLAGARILEVVQGESVHKGDVVSSAEPPGWGNLPVRKVAAPAGGTSPKSPGKAPADTPQPQEPESSSPTPADYVPPPPPPPGG